MSVSAEIIAALQIHAENLFKTFQKNAAISQLVFVLYNASSLTPSEKTISSFNLTHMKKQFLLCFPLLLFYFYSQAQTITVTGTVRDQNGGAVPFATVTETGSGTSAVADSAGRFTIRTQSGARLTVTAVGFQGQTLTVTGPTLDFTLRTGPDNLQEVVVTAVGQTRRRAQVGYSTTTITNENLNRGAPVNLFENMGGKIAGAEISQTGGPGSSTKVILRGFGIISGGSNNPLYVVDGIPLTDARFGATTNTDFGNTASDINPNDVESMTVLKGTAATSLYGSQARNGAILITTRRGRSGKLRIDYSGSANFSSVGKLPDYQDQFGQGWGSTFILSENGSWGPRLDGRERVWGATVDNSQLAKPFVAINNNMRDFYDIGQEFNNTLALSGGSGNNQFYFSYGNVTSNGPIPSAADMLERNTFALRTNSRFNNFTFNTSFNYINRKMNAPLTGQGSTAGASVFESVLQIPVDIPIKDLRDYQNFYFNVNNYFTPFAENPYYPLFENKNTQNEDRFFGNIDMSYRFLSWLNLQWRVGGDFASARTFGYRQVNAPAPGSWNAGNNPENAPRAPDIGSVSELTDYIATINSDLILRINKPVSRDFTIEGLAGLNFYQQQQRGTAASITNLVIPGFFNLSNSNNPPTATDSRLLRRLIGLYAQAVVGYRDEVFLTVNARNDWSSTLPLNNNAFFYPGAQLSWVASQTFDFSRTEISLLKLRAAYGKTGADPVPYQVDPTLALGTVTLPFGSILFPFNGVSGFGISNTLTNPSLQPIITSEAELGAEASFFQNRLGFDVSLYDKRTKGQIFTAPVAPSSGYTGLVRNLGVVQNKGIEITVNTTPVKTKNFTWTTINTFTKNKNKVLNLTGGPASVLLLSLYDAELRAFPGRSVAGIYAPKAQVDSLGRLIVNPQTGMPLTTEERQYYGSGEYDFITGMQNMFTFKNSLSLGFSLDYRKGGVMYSGTSDLALFVGNSYITTYNDRKPFVIPNSVVAVTDAQGHTSYEENTTPILQENMDTYYYPTGNPAMAYQQRIIDRSFLKLRDVTISYQLPKQWASGIGANNLSVTLYGRNLLLWTPESNIYIDPEASNLGNDLNSELGEFRTAPTYKTFGIAIRAGF
jgi:TonB-linked SusC/RagA family outer membrane protein